MGCIQGETLRFVWDVGLFILLLYMWCCSSDVYLLVLNVVWWWPHLLQIIIKSWRAKSWRFWKFLISKASIKSTPNWVFMFLFCARWSAITECEVCSENELTVHMFWVVEFHLWYEQLAFDRCCVVTSSHTPCHNCGMACRMSFSIHCWYQSMSFIICYHATTLSALHSSLNLWWPRFFFSTVNRWYLSWWNPPV